MTLTQILAAAYNAGVEEEYNRLESTPAFRREYQLVTSMIDKYISSESTVFDIGSGPGRYSEYLLKNNCTVGAVDISCRSLDFLKSRINGNYGNRFLFAGVDCATGVHWIESNSADAVLLMGPLYHLTQNSERMQALAHAYRIVKPGGFIFTVFMTTFYCNAGENMPVPNECVTEVLFQGYPVEQYRCCPQKAGLMIKNAGFEIKEILDLGNNIEEQINLVPNQQILSVLSHEENIEQSISENASQFLCVGIKPF